MNWPQGFFDFLNAFRLRDGRNVTGQLHKDLSGIHINWIRVFWSHPEFQFLQEAYNQYLLENKGIAYTTTFVHRRLVQDFRAEFPCINSEEVAEILGTTIDMVKRLVATGFLVSDAQANGQVSPPFSNTFFVRQAEVMELQQKWQGLISLSDAAQLLGTSKDTILNLINSGLLETIDSFDTTGSQVRLLSFASITKFITRLQGSTMRMYPPMFSVEPVDLVTATQMLSIYGINIASIVKMLLKRELRGYWLRKEFSLDRLTIYHRDVETLIMGLHDNRPLITREQVAYMMRVYVWNVRAWVEDGLLEPIGKRNGVVYFDLEAVRSFQKQKLSLRDKNRLVSISPS